ncbi:hypothetical protein [Gordonia sp. CPCC 205333]|uniref:hypothetical protein n=1 Tax=Gordonia sp. CPCC 205333 TaxID=3140790 RepID=UPI003AF331C4
MKRKPIHAETTAALWPTNLERPHSGEITIVTASSGSSALTEPIAVDDTLHERPADFAADKGCGVPVLKVVLDVAGTALLIVAAANLTNVGDWVIAGM